MIRTTAKIIAAAIGTITTFSWLRRRSLLAQLHSRNPRVIEATARDILADPFRSPYSPLTIEARGALARLAASRQPTAPQRPANHHATEGV